MPDARGSDRGRGRAPHRPRDEDEGAELIRLQRVLASAGVGSRRRCEELIDEGRVEVDGRVVRRQGMRVDPASAVIRVDGARLVTDTELVHLALHKPAGVVSTMADDQGRPCVGDIVADRSVRLFHVGRLDVDTEGLLLLTNEGELAHRLAHPSYRVPKTYLAEVPGPLGRGVLRRLRDGVDLEDGAVRVDSVRPVGAAGGRVMLEIVLHEGRNHVVRRLLDAVGHPVARLVRTHVGPVALGSLKPGRTRRLTSVELSKLYRMVGL